VHDPESREPVFEKIVRKRKDERDDDLKTVIAL
jgi:hypothetical protein